MSKYVSLDDICLYCQVSGESGRLLVDSLSNAAEEFLLSIDITPNDRNRERFALTVKAMTLHELENPGAERPEGIQQMINNLKFQRCKNAVL